MSKGGGKGHTPREAKDDLKSTQQLSVIDALSEGPIVGPVSGQSEMGYAAGGKRCAFCRETDYRRRER